MRPIIKNSTIYILFICFIMIQAPAKAVPFFPDKPGEVLDYQGTIKIGSDSRTITKTLTVHKPYLDTKSQKTWIVHEISIVAAGKNELQVSYFEVRTDGVYCVAEATALDQKPHILDPAYLVIPLQVKPGSQWQTDRKNKGKKISLEYKVLGSEPVTAGQNIYDCMIMKATGEAKVMGLSIPMERTEWLNADIGLIQQITTQTISNTKTITTLKLVPKKK